jgi:peptide-methionine (S)-S-oxide reductase
MDEKTELVMNQEYGKSQSAGSDLQVATMGGGCFWCLDPIFKDLKGVVNVVVGYSGGTGKNPSYRMVCTGTTGHAESLQVTFDPNVISYKELLKIFFSFHDPTTLNRQGADVGTQYRSVIFYHNESQKAIAEETIAEFEKAGVWGKPIVTEVTSFDAFYPAEDYHQDYFKNNPMQGYCRVVIAPKVTKFRQHYADLIKQEQV